MKIYFCPECGAYSASPDPFCKECHVELPRDSWAEVTSEELQQLEYVEEFELPVGLPSWEYDVVRLKSDADTGGIQYTTAILKGMGDKGWELVNIVPLGDKDGPRYGVFKRSWLSDFEE